MKVNINQDDCIEYGAYEQTCLEVFVVGSSEKARIVTKYQRNTPGLGEIPNDLVACVEDAIASCPVQVISMG